MADDDRIRELLDEHGDRLNQWEQEFLDSLDEWDGELRPEQEAKLAEVHERVTRRR